jgi:hypothetical protein
MEILQIIDKQVKWYYDNSHKVWIDDLITFQDKLAVNSYYLAQVYAEAYQEYLTKIYNTKTKKIKTFLSKKAEKIEDKILTDKLAQNYADDESLTEFCQELFKDWEREKLRVLLMQVNKILDWVRTRISFLKKELELN